MRAKMLDGVTSSSTAPITPPRREMITSARKGSPPAPATCRRPPQLEVIWPGKSATVDVILAASAVIPVNISAGRVRNVPPPARAFCTPAHTATRKSTIIAVMNLLSHDAGGPGKQRPAPASFARRARL